MKIVLFGATGNIGRRIVAEALRRGHEVVGVVRDPAAVESPDPRVRRRPGSTGPISVRRLRSVPASGPGNTAPPTTHC